MFDMDKEKVVAAQAEMSKIEDNFQAACRAINEQLSAARTVRSQALAEPEKVIAAAYERYLPAAEAYIQKHRLAPYNRYGSALDPDESELTEEGFYFKWDADHPYDIRECTVTWEQLEEGYNHAQHQ